MRIEESVRDFCTNTINLHEEHVGRDRQAQENIAYKVKMSIVIELKVLGLVPASKVSSLPSAYQAKTTL